MKKGVKRRIAFLTVLILIINLFSPYSLLLNNVQAASGTVPDPVVVFNKIQDLTEKNGNKFFKVQVAVVGDVNLNGIDVKLSYDNTKIEPANKTSGKAATAIGMISEVYPDIADGSYDTREYDKDTQNFRMVYIKGGGHDLPDLGYAPGEGWDDVYPGYDQWAASFDYYLPIITYTFRVKDDSMTDDDITTDLFKLVPVRGSLPTGAQIVYFNATGVDVAYNINKIVGIGFAEAGKEVDSIAVTKDPTKMEYNHGDTVDLTGGEITVTYTDGTSEVVSLTDSKVNIDFGQTADVKNPSSQISYGGKNTTITWTVNDPIIDLSVTKPMNDIEYDHGEDFNFTGLELTATKKSGTKEILNANSIGVSISEIKADVNSSKFTQTGTNGSMAVGDQKIEFTYQGKMATTTVVVNDTVDSVTLVSQPNKVVYKHGETLNLAGASLEVTLSSGNKLNVNLPDGAANVSTYSSSTTGVKQHLSVTFAGKSVAQTIDVEVYDYIKSSTLTEPTKYEYQIGESLSTAGGSLKLVWQSGKVTNVSLNNSMVSPLDSNTVGTKHLTVAYTTNYTLSDGTTIPEQIIKNFDVEVVNSIEKITVKAPTKDKYNHGDSLDLVGGTITITYADKTTSTVPMTTAMIKEADGSNVNMSPAIGAFGSDNTLNKTLKIEYTEDGVTGKIDYPITIVNDVREITVHTTPKNLYNVNDPEDITNGEISVKRAVGTDEIVSMSDNRVKVSGFDSSVEHTKLPIKVEFTENGITEETSYTIDVKDSVKSIAMDNTPKTDYKYQEPLDLTGGTITVVKGSETKSIPITADMVSGYDPEKLGEQTITVTYGGEKTEYKVTVKDYVTGITVTPASVNGTYGDILADVIANVKYSVNYAKGGATTPVALPESMVDGYVNNVITAQELDVKYTDNDLNSATKGTEFTGKITITLADEVDTIAITAPTKDKYNHGDSLDLVGGTITVTTKSGASKVVPMTTAMIKEADGSNVNISPAIGAFGSDNTLSKTLKIEYTEGGVTESIDYPITIVNDVREITVHTTPKDLYNVNDKEDLTGGEISVKRAVGTDEVVSMSDNRVKVSGFDSSVEHTKLPIKVEFTENGITEETSYTIDVKDSVKSIAMDNTPKTDYKYQEPLDLTGGTITIVKGSETKSIPITADMVSG